MGEASVYRSVIVTGGAGLLGRALGEVLSARGIAYTSLNRAGCDLTDTQQVERVFERSRPTLLINCAADSKVDRCELEPHVANAVNGEAVGTLARLAKRFDTYLVHYSTDFVFDGARRRPYRPDDEPKPLSVYGRSKLLGEQMLQANAPPQRWMILRTSGLFGHGGACFPRTILERARLGLALAVVSDSTTKVTYARDLAAATLDLVGHGAGGLLHVANAGELSWHEFARAILAVFGRPSDVRPITSEQSRAGYPHRASRPLYSVLDCSAAEGSLGRPLRPWQEALADYRTRGISL